MATVKESWKKVGSDFGELGKDIGSTGIGKDIAKIGKDLGKSVVKTVKHGVQAVSKWADEEDAPVAEAEPVEEPADGTPAEEPAEEGEVIDE